MVIDSSILASVGIVNVIWCARDIPFLLPLQNVVILCCFSHLSKLSTALDKPFTDYENIILMSEFNVEVEEKNMSQFMSVYNLRNLVKQNILKTLKTHHV